MYAIQGVSGATNIPAGQPVDTTNRRKVCIIATWTGTLTGVIGAKVGGDPSRMSIDLGNITSAPFTVIKGAQPAGGVGFLMVELDTGADYIVPYYTATSGTGNLTVDITAKA